jgi:hypothetical protein
MGTTLTGTTIKTTYDSLIKVTDNGPLSGTAKFLSDGLGNDSVLALSTSRVTIGGTNPYVGLLTIYGTASFSGGLGLRNSAGTAAGFLATYAAGSGSGSTDMSIGSAGFLEINTAGVERMRITSTGNVGIGTSTPAQKLRIKAGNGDQLGLDNAGERFTQISFLNNAAQKAAIWLDETVDEFVIYAAAGYTTPIYANAIERVRVTNNGLTFNGDTAAANALDDYEEGTFTPVMVGATFTLTTALGYYTKIGRQVSIWVEIEGTYSSPTAVFRVSSLPFTQAGGRAEGVFAAINGISFGGYCSAEILGTVMYLESHASGTGANRTDMNSTFFNAAGFRFMVSATYFV